MSKIITNFFDILSTGEAAELWNIDSRKISSACIEKKAESKLMLDVECRKSHNSWLVTYQGMLRLYGEAPNEREFVNSKIISSLRNTLTCNEAALLWGVHKENIKRACAGQVSNKNGRTNPRFMLNVEYRKSGNIWLVTVEGMERLYGKMRNKQTSAEPTFELIKNVRKHGNLIKEKNRLTSERNNLILEKNRCDQRLLEIEELLKDGFVKSDKQ